MSLLATFKNENNREKKRPEEQKIFKIYCVSQVEKAKK